MPTTLFEPDNFTRPEIKYRPALEGERERLVPVLRRYAPRASFVSLDEFDGAEINSQNFRVTIKAENGKEEMLFLKRYKSFPAEQLTFQIGFLKNLAQHKVKVNHALPATDGSTWITEEGERYAMFRFLQASHFKPSDESWTNTSRAIGGMHRAFRELRDTYYEPIATLSHANTSPGAYFNKIHSYSLADIVEIKKSQHSDGRGIDQNIFIAAVEALENAMRIKLTEPAHGPIARDIIHSDLHPHNILMNGDEVAAIIDFDSLRPSEIARDAAFFIYRFGRQFFVREGGRADLESVTKEAKLLREKALAVYLLECSLSDEEVSAMGPLLMDEFIIKMLFVLRGVYIDGNATWASNLPKFTMALLEIPLFFKE